MSDTPSMPTAYKILFDHKVDSFRASILGTSLGTLIDKGLTDLEILAVIEGFCTMIRSAAKDPRMLASLESQAQMLAELERVAQKVLAKL